MSNRTLTRNGYIMHKKFLTPAQTNMIKKDLTVTPTVLPAFKEMAKPRPYKIYLESPERWFLPRYYGIEKFGEAINTNIAEGKLIDITVKIQLRPHQITAAENIKKQFAAGHGGVLSLPCGYGKTVLAIWAIAHLGKKTLVVVNKEFLMDQWMNSFEQFSNARVGILQQNKIEIDGNDVVIAMLHSLCLKDYPKNLFDEFGLVIFDECHHIASEMFSKALPKVATKYMLGLSATPERKDGLSRVFYYYLGNLFHQERRVGTNLVVVKQIRIMSDSPYYQDLFLANGVKNTTGMISQLSEFDERNKLIIFILELLILQGRTTLVLSSRREHLEVLYKLLQAANFRKKDGSFVTYGLYYGKQGMNKKQYKKMLDESAKCDIVLGTCQLAQEGLDIPTLDTLLFATPMTDIIQAVGRILRKFHQINPMVVDIIDKFGNFTKHAALREKFYNEEDYICEKENITLYDSAPSSTGSTKNIYQKVLTTFINSIPDPTQIRNKKKIIGRTQNNITNAEDSASGSADNCDPANLADPLDQTDDDDSESRKHNLPKGCLLPIPNETTLPIIDPKVTASPSSASSASLATKIPVSISVKKPVKIPTQQQLQLQHLEQLQKKQQTQQEQLKQSEQLPSLIQKEQTHFFTPQPRIMTTSPVPSHAVTITKTTTKTPSPSPTSTTAKSPIKLASFKRKFF